MPDGLSFSVPRLALTTDTVGGVWRYTMELAAALSAHGVAVSVVTLGPPPTDAQRAEVLSVRAKLVETDLPLDWTAPDAATLARAVRTLVSVVHQTGCDSVHLHAPALADADYGCPVVAVAHSCVATWWRAVKGDAPLPDDLAWRAEATARGLDRADAVIAPTHAFADALRAAYGPTRRIEVVRNGRTLAPVADHGERRAGVLAAGRLWDPAKGMDVLDSAASAVPIEAAGPSTGPQGQTLGPSRLRLLGALGESAMLGAMRRARVFAAPARYEPFGLAVLEAALSGCALVLSDIPTFRELWDGVATFVPVGDVAAWRDALTRPHAAGIAQDRARTFTADRMVAATLRVRRLAGVVR